MRRRHALAAAIFLALTVLHTWPLASDPARMSRIHDDEWLNAWAVSWVAHQLPRDPLHVFDSNMFHPADQSMRYTEPLVVPGIIGAPFRWLGASPLLTHNLLIFAGFLFTALAMYRLVVHWTGDPWSGILAGALLAFGTAMATRIAHIQFLHFYAFPFAVLALDRLLTGGRARDAAWVGVWVIVAALTSGYLVVLVVTTLGAAFIIRAGDWWGRRGAGIAARLGAAAAVTGAVLALLMRPYLGSELRRGSVVDAESIGASLQGFLRTAADLHYGLWSERFWSGEAPSAMFPGVVAIALAGAALAARRRHAPRGIRRMLTGIAAAGTVLSLGMLTPVYGALATVMPPLLGLRSPSRFAMLAVFALAALAGIGWSAVRARLNPRWQTAAAVGLLALATLESLHAPIPLPAADARRVVSADLPSARGGAARADRRPASATHRVLPRERALSVGVDATLAAHPQWLRRVLSGQLRGGGPAPSDLSLRRCDRLPAVRRSSDSDSPWQPDERRPLPTGPRRGGAPAGCPAAGPGRPRRGLSHRAARRPPKGYHPA